MGISETSIDMFVLYPTANSVWQDHGLTAEPDVGNNVVHASASPFEGMCERMNWLETPCRKDICTLYLCTCIATTWELNQAVL